MKKITIEHIREQFTKEGYTLLSEEYINNKQHLYYVCSNGHKHRSRWDNWIQSKRCPYCEGQGKPSFEEVKKLFKEEGYTLLSKEYINNRTKLGYICPNKHLGSTSWGNWKRLGNRCGYCAKNVRHTLEYVQKSFEKEKYTLLSTEYINQKQKLNYICSNGHNNSITWTDWNNGGYRCPTCYFIRNSGSGNTSWKGGISFEPYCEIWKDKEYKHSIRERDGNKCLNPYCCSKTPNDLIIHHIDYNKKNCKPINLTTICRSCNAMANTDREWHTAWYQALMYMRYNYKYSKLKGDLNE